MRSINDTYLDAGYLCAAIDALDIIEGDCPDKAHRHTKKAVSGLSYWTAKLARESEDDLGRDAD